MQPRNRTHILIPTLITLVAAALRITTLGKNAVWWDEGFSVWLARQPLGAMLYQTAIDVHPPLYYLSLAGWRLLAGESPFALRLLTVFWGLIAAALVYRVGRSAHSHTAGLIAALLVAVSPIWVSWSMELRMYGQAIALCALALWAAIKLIDPRTRHPWRWAAILAVAEAAGLLSLFIVAGAIVALNAGALAAFITRSDRWKFALRWGGAQAAALAIFLPWYLYSSRTGSWQAAPPPIDLWFTLKLYLSVFLVGVEENIDGVWPLIVLAGVILAGAAYCAWQASPSPQPERVKPHQAGASSPGGHIFPLILLGVVLPPLLMIGLFLLPRSERFNIAGPAGRYFLVMSIPIYVLVGWGITAAGRRWKIAYAALAVLVVMLAGSLFTRTYPARAYTDDYDTLATAIEALRQPGDAVLLDNDFEWPVFAYHYADGYTPISQERLRTRRIAREMLTPIMESSGGVWLVLTPFAAESDPDGFIQSVLSARAARIDRYSFPQAELVFYALTPERAAASPPAAATSWPPGMRPASLRISEGVTLAGVVVPRQPVSAGTTLGIGLAWHVEPGAEGEWPVAARLVGRDGAEIASAAVTLKSPSPGDYYQPVTMFLPTFGETGPAGLVLVAGQNSAVLGGVNIEPTHDTLPPEATLPPGAHPLDIRFGEHITLVAASLPDKPAWKPNETIPLRLYWSSDAPLSERYKGFAHLAGGQINARLGSPLWGQDDHEPGGGFAPTTLWRPGALIEDGYGVIILPNTPAGTYRLEVGLYLPLDLSNLLAIGPGGASLGGAAQVMTIKVER